MQGDASQLLSYLLSLKPYNNENVLSSTVCFQSLANMLPLKKLLFFGLEGFWGQPQGSNFPSPQATMLVLCLDCSTAALTTPQKVLPI